MCHDYESEFNGDQLFIDGDNYEEWRQAMMEEARAIDDAEEMDGDYESALGSAGWEVDEDYFYDYDADCRLW